MLARISLMCAALALAGCGRLGFESASVTGCLGCMDAGGTTPVCGNGELEGEEACDDGNAIAGDGCDNDCTFSCEADTECDDGLACNGTETCDPEGHHCAEGAALEDGTPCEGERVCRGGACASITCGNGVVDAGEECDDENLEPGDGCDNDCSFSCTTDEECADGDACNGVEACGDDHACIGGEPAGIGSLCERDGVADTRDICLETGCVRSVCGDGFQDDAEECDDGNVESGDGCESDCTLPVVEDAGPTDDGGGDGAPTDSGGDVGPLDASPLPDSGSGDGGSGCSGGDCRVGFFCCGTCGGTTTGTCIPETFSCTAVCPDGGASS